MLKKIYFTTLFSMIVFIIYQLIVKSGPSNDENETQLPITPEVKDQAIKPSERISPAKTIEQKIEVKPDSQIQEKKLPKSRRITQDEGHYPVDEQGNIYITQALVNEEYIFSEYDIILETVDQMKSVKEGKELKIPRPQLWPNAEVFYVFDNSLDQSQKIDMQNVLEDIQAKVSVKFVVRKFEENYIKIKKGKDHCLSHMGMIGGEQVISLSSSCDKSSYYHEVFHALGLYHEQSRKDRDDYLLILWENIEKKYHAQFQKIPWELYDLQEHPLDYNSIMLYPPYAFSLASDRPSIITLDGGIYQRSDVPTAQDWQKLRALYQ